MGCGSSTDVSPPQRNPAKPAAAKRLGYSRHRVNSAVSFYQRTARKGSEVDPNEIKLSVEAAHNVSQIHRGNPDVERCSDVKIVRIFTSSTFTDTKEERNALMERVYPQLKIFCQKLGYEFQVVDMRWGVRSEATDNHMTTEHCLKELKACQQLSTGPNFVTFLSHKYGYRPFPRIIEADEFETITKNLLDEDKEVVNIWFKKDENADPPEYVLQPISAVFPEFNSPDAAAQSEASDKWWNVFVKLQQILKDGATANLTDEEARHQYFMSVTENEIVNGILQAPNTETHCMWFKRNIAGVEEAEGRTVGKYYDGSDEEAKKLLVDLRENKVPQKLSQDNTINYDVQWREKGIDPDDAEHKAYIDKLCEDFHTRIQAQIEAGVRERQAKEVADPLYNEIVQHINFSQAKCKQFHGRRDVLEKLRDYVRGTSDQPLVLVGMSGSGKTSLLAQAAQSAWQWFGDNGSVIYRFIGTTQSSSSLRPLLGSLTSQILKVYLKKAQEPRQELKYLVEDFKQLLSLATKERPLLILLDSLDQLDNMDGGRHLHWLPRHLPPHCKMILSTLPQEIYGCLQRLEGLFPAASCYLEVNVMSMDDILGILDKWLKLECRKLTDRQRDYLISCYKECPLPLYLKLSFDEALRWHSYDPPDVNRLQATVAATISALLTKIEIVHGLALVSFALGCITASQGGLSESEIEDIISLSDTVLNDVYQFWTPPFRRLPPLLWVRVRNDLEQYLVNRGVDGVQVIYWYHRQFIEVARERYLTNEESTDNLHLSLAEFFLGIWADRPKPYVGKNGNEDAAMRYVAKQPLQFEGGEFNLRKLNQLPFHLISAGELNAVKSQALCNFPFLLAKLEAVSFRAVLQDLKDACTVFPLDSELHIVRETLQLARDGLNSDSRELAGQLAARIHGTGSGPLLEQAKAMQNAGTLPPEAMQILTLLEAFEEKHKERNKHLIGLLDGSKAPMSPAFVPHRGFLVPPGGQLLHKLAEHTDVVVDVEITNDGRLAATGSYDNTAKVWDIRSGEMLQSIDFPENVGDVRFCRKDEWLAVSCWKKQLYIVNVDIGTIIHQHIAPKGPDFKDLCMPIVMCNVRGRDFVVGMRNTAADVWDVETGQRMKSLQLDLDDWSTHHLGTHITRRHLVGNISSILYAGYRGSGYFIRSITEDTLNRQVQLFEEYKYDKHSKSPDFAPSRADHIGALALTPDGTVVVVGNGGNKDILLVVFETGQKVKVLKGQGSARMQSFHFPPASDWFYYAIDNMVGTISIRESSNKVMLPHPCKVRKVVGIDGNKNVITIGEDSILYIWDKSMPPFQQDLSMITGKVTVKSQEAANQAADTFKQMMGDILGEDVGNIEDMVTTAEVENYWSKDPIDPDDDKATGTRVRTTFHVLPGRDYAAVVHSDTHTHNAICLTFWELTHTSCIRRMFLPPDKVQVHSIIRDEYILLSERRKIYLMKIDTWDIALTFKGRLPEKYDPFLRPILEGKEILAESDDGTYFQVYSTTSGDETGALVPGSDDTERHISTSSNKSPLVSSAQVNESQTTLAALFTSGDLHFWDLKARSYIRKIQTPKYLGIIKGDMSHEFNLSRDGEYVILTRDFPQIMWSSYDDQHNSCVIINIRSGKSLGNPPMMTAAQRMAVRISLLAPVIRKFRHKVLQVFGVDERGQAVTIDQVDAGVHTRHVRITPDKRYLVTWCPEPKEKTLRCWSLKDNDLAFVASFTPDKEVTDIALVDGVHTLLIDSPGGVIKLFLKGIDEESLADESSSTPVQEKKLFSGVDLDIQYESPVTSNGAAH